SVSDGAGSALQRFGPDGGGLEHQQRGRLLRDERVGGAHEQRGHVHAPDRPDGGPPHHQDRRPYDRGSIAIHHVHDRRVQRRSGTGHRRDRDGYAAHRPHGRDLDVFG